MWSGFAFLLTFYIFDKPPFSTLYEANKWVMANSGREGTDGGQLMNKVLRLIHNINRVINGITRFN